MNKSHLIVKPHLGFNSDRLSEAADNPREVAFAQQWSSLNMPVARIGTPLLQHLIGEKFTGRDAMVAATVIQWLGSNVGMSFIQDVAAAEPKVAAWLGLPTPL